MFDSAQAFRSVRDDVAATARALDALTRAGVVRPVRPDRLARMAGALGRYRFTLTAGYVAGAARHPDRAAILDDAGQLTYGELHERTDRLARALRASGVGPGTRVGVAVPQPPRPGGRAGRHRQDRG